MVRGYEAESFISALRGLALGLKVSFTLCMPCVCPLNGIKQHFQLCKKQKLNKEAKQSREKGKGLFHAGNCK